MIVFTLEENEAQFVIKALGQLPTESGVFPLFQKLQQQYQESLTPKE
jgi:hypothetical protein